MSEQLNNSQSHERIPEPHQSELVEHYQVPPFGVRIDIDKPLFDARAALEKERIDAPVVAAMRVGAGEAPDPRRDYIIVDTRNMPDNVEGIPFIVRSMGDEPVYMEVRANEPITIHGATEDEGVEVLFDGQGLKLWVASGDMPEPSYLFANAYPVHVETDTGLVETKTRDMISTRTRTMQAILKRHMFPVETPEAPDGLFRGYTFIGRNTPSVREGIWGEATVGNQELIYIDSEGAVLSDIRETFQQKLQEIPEEDRLRRPSIVIGAVVAQVQELMHYSIAGVDAVTAEYPSQHGSTDVIPLSTYVERGIGVCRQQSLLAALLLEAARDAGFLKGEVRVEGNRDRNTGEGHMWAIWKFPGAREDVVIDAANGFYGLRSAAKEKLDWEYMV